MKTPVIPKALIEYLERLYPDRTPDLTDSDRMVWYNAGRVSVVRKLRAEYEKQNANILENVRTT